MGSTGDDRASCIYFGKPLWLTLVALISLLVGSGRAEDNSAVLGGFSLTSGGEPIEITSDRLDFDYKERKTIFRGEVHVVQGDIELDSDLLTVRFLEDGGQRSVDRIAADGNVVIRQGARIATGDYATFDEQSRTLELTGNAILEEGSNRASGETIIVYPDESRMEIRAENSRVKLILFPKESPAPAVSRDAAGTSGSPDAPTPEPKTDGLSEGAAG
jgi:lipopolysaccharide export system protein LptA